ncbi:hypothetical protein [Gemmobacter sp.]|uniref:AtuA-related protein n=1 Tax=Gemmobacter sp. TaxID=1898957 RepID=UPI002AFF2B1D|nr:hypothetical protein [Gemmobacter sp.]
MSRTVPLRQIATARAGDKGDTSNIAVWVRDPADYPAVRRGLTAERVKAAYPALFRGQVTRYDLPALHGLNFVIEKGLEGGVNASLNADAHGKSFSFLLLALDIELD